MANELRDSTNLVLSLPVCSSFPVFLYKVSLPAPATEKDPVTAGMQR